MDFGFDVFDDYLNNGRNEKGVFARFYDKFVKTGAMLENGLPEYKEKLYIEIKTRGSADVVNRLAENSDFRRFPREYNFYLTKKEKMKDGTPLNQFAFLNAQQVETCDMRGILTVEDLAALSDEKAKELNLINEKKCAVRFLEVSKDNAVIAKYEAENAALKEKIAALEDKIKALQDEK